MTYAVNGGYCSKHEPGADLTAQSRAGGRAAHAHAELKPNFKSAESIKRTLERATRLVALGKISSPAGRTIAMLCEKALRAVEAANEEALLNLEDQQREQR